MDEEVDYTRPVKVPWPIRILLGVVVLVGGVAFAAVGLMFLVVRDWADAPHPIGLLVLQVLLLVMGLAFAYVGMRVLAVKDGDRMLSPGASRIGGVFMVVLGLMIISFALFAHFPEFVEHLVTGGALIAWGVWMLRSNKGPAPR
jgi:hypothetical protein